MAYERVKKHFLIDTVIAGTILVAVVVLVMVSTRTLPGWDVKGETEILQEQDKEVQSDVIIRERGEFRMGNSSLTVSSTYRNQYGIRISGDSLMEIEDSEVICGGFQCYIVAYADEDGKSPSIISRNSSFENHTGILLTDRTRFSGERSSLGELHVQNDVNATLISSTVIPVLYSRDAEEYDGLSPGDSVSGVISSKTGWELELDSCVVPWFRLELLEDDVVAVRNSSGVVLGMHSPGDLDEPVALDLDGIGTRSSGELEGLWFDFSWESSRIDRVFIYLSGEDSIDVKDGILGDVEIIGSSQMEITGSLLSGSRYLVSGDSRLSLDSVAASVSAGTVTLVISGSSHVIVTDSDMTGIQIQLAAEGSLEVQGSKVDRNAIENNGTGSVIIDGEELGHSD